MRVVKKSRAGWLCWIACALLACTGCGAGGGGVPGDGGVPGTGDAPGPGDAPTGEDGGIPGEDGGVDAPPGEQNPFPDDPKGGEFAWVVSAPGAGDSVVVAVDQAGNIVVAARQTGEVTIGSLRVPPPSSPEALLVLKLTADGKPVWGRSVLGAQRIDPRGIATTTSGDVVVGAVLQDRPVPGNPFDAQDGLVTVLDANTGDTRWSVALASDGEDRVTGIVAGPDAAGDEAIYVLGKLSGDAAISGHTVKAGGFLLRYDDDSALRWAQSFPGLTPGFQHSLALDPARGPVIAGNFLGDLALGDQTLPGGGALVAGFDPEGQVRFVRPLLSDSSSFHHQVTVGRGGDVYLASTTERTETLADGHVVSSPDPSEDHPYLARLTPHGHHAFSRVITGERPAEPQSLTADASGAVHLIIRCDDRVHVQPEVACASRNGGVIVSHDVNNIYQWATYVEKALVESIAAAPGNRLIVAGQALGDTTDFGGVRVSTAQLFIAALAGGAARLPSPLPPAPVISSMTLEGPSNGQIRQGGTGTLVIQGEDLDHVTSARLGDIHVHVPPDAGTATTLRLPVTIPHGHAPGSLAVVLANASGSAQSANFLMVTPVVVTPSGSDSGRGTFASPMRLCRDDWSSLVRHGDVMLLRNGVHTCDDLIGLRRGVTVRGESKAGTIVRAPSGSSRMFEGFLASDGAFGVLAIENLTIESARSTAIWLPGRGEIAVTDVDIQGVVGSGMVVESGGAATVSRYRYLRSSGTAIVIDGGHVDARGVQTDDVLRGVRITRGSLTLADSSVSSREHALEAGDINALGGTRDITITNTTLRSKGDAIMAIASQLTIRGSTIVPVAPTTEADGVVLAGGTCTMTDSSIRDWPGFGIFTWNVFGLSEESGGAVHLTLDHVDITSSFGVHYDGGAPGGRFHLRNSRVRGTLAVSLSGGFASSDLGTAASPGNNQLETTSGEPSLIDHRVTAGSAVDAHGTTLNGVVLEGEVLGPATAAGYRIAGPNTIRF